MQIIKTLCTRCQKPITLEWPDRMDFGGETVTAQEYLDRALSSNSVYVACDDCLAAMPDVKLDELHLVYQ